MRLSIKYNLPLVIILIFVIHSASVLLYLGLFLPRNIQQNIEKTRDNLEKINQSVCLGISDRYPDNDKVRSFLNTQAELKNIKISVKDTEKRTVFSASKRNFVKKDVKITVKDFAYVNGKIAYAVELDHSISLKEIIGIDFVESVLFFSLFVLMMAIFVIIVYLHFYIVKPLARIKERFGVVGYNKNSMPVVFKRKDEIGDLSRKFEEMVMELEASNQQQNEMISSISHDLKTPLTSIMGYVERLMYANVKEEKKQEYFRIIYKKAEDIKNLTDEFSDFTKNEVDLYKMGRERTPVKEFFTSICSEYKEELQAFNVEFEYREDIPEDVFFEIDEKKIRRVFANLISNSLKYRTESAKIRLSCSLKKESAVFGIEDNGGGVPEEELTNIFNKFYRIDKSRSQEKGGTGLGLAICKSIVESHGGEISAYNNQVIGLGITFKLPLSK